MMTQIKSDSSSDALSFDSSNSSTSGGGGGSINKFQTTPATTKHISSQNGRKRPGDSVKCM